MPTSDTSGSEPSESQLRESVIRKISGFTPAMTGTMCDACNHCFDEGATVWVLARYYAKPNGSPGWALSRTHCESCADSLVSDPDEEVGTEAVVKCELGALAGSGEAAPLYNPDVVRVTVGADLRSDDGAEGGSA